MLSLGKIEEFSLAAMNIDRYLEWLEQYFEANSVPADSAESHKRRAILEHVFRECCERGQTIEGGISKWT